MNITSNRSGTIVQVASGYSAFVPSRLPPDPPIRIDDEMQMLLSMADRKLGRLDGITRVLPNPDLFLAMYVKKEAVLSSQIEGTQASLVDVLQPPSKNATDIQQKMNVADVVNYVKAMNYGLKRLETLPLSLRLIREIHACLLHGVRGTDKNPGEFRKTQNWIGTQNCTLATASFVPPPADKMVEAMEQLEMYIHDEGFIAPLIKIALIHAQFETIHPFLDGNGRVGRLLITFWLCQQEILSKPLLYLSYYFKLHRTEYYERLMNVRLHGQWEEWIKFFLKGVSFVADEAINSATAIIKMKSSFSELIARSDINNRHSQRLLENLFESPIITRKEVAEYLVVSSPTAGTLLSTFCDLGILTDADPEKQRNKEYYFQDYLDILEKGTEQ